MKKIVMDIDNTITAHDPSLAYKDMQPNWRVVKKLYDYRVAGFTITLFTARNMRTYEGNLGLINKYTVPDLLSWLEENEIPYDELIVGKPWCGHDGFYVDDKAIRPDEFVNLSYDEIKEIIR